MKLPLCAGNMHLPYFIASGKEHQVRIHSSIIPMLDFSLRAGSLSYQIPFWICLFSSFLDRCGPWLNLGNKTSVLSKRPVAHLILKLFSRGNSLRRHLLFQKPFYKMNCMKCVWNQWTAFIFLCLSLPEFICSVV